MPILKNKTPYDILFMESSSFDRIKFWVLVYAHHNQKKKHKFDSRSQRCIFVGYPFAKKGWKVYDLETGEIFISRDVLFHEDQFPFHAKTEEREPQLSSDGAIGNGGRILMKEGMVNGSVILMGLVNHHSALQHLMAARLVKVGLCRDKMRQARN